MSELEGGGSQSLRRHKALFDATTGLSERQPYNVIDLRWPDWPTLFRVVLFPLWVCLLLLSQVLRFAAATLKTAFYYMPRPDFIFPKYKLDESGAINLGAKAHPRVVQYLSEQALRELDDLAKAKDMTYLLIRGMPTVSPFCVFPTDSVFAERDRDAEHVIKRLDGKGSAPDPDYHVHAAKRRARKRERLDRKFRHADLVVAGLAHHLKCKIWSRFENDFFARNILTDPGEQQSSDLDNLDMALRFAQSTVEKNLPEADLPTNDETCAYRIYLCIKNWARVPIYLITVREIIDTYLCQHNPKDKQKVLDMLSAPQFERRGPRFDSNQSVISTDVLEKCPIIARDFLHPGGWVMAFDHERVQPVSESPAQGGALIELREAVRRARRDAIKIVMRPGDVLIVDNLRAQVSRRDYYPANIWQALRLLPAYVRITRTRTDKTDPDAKIKVIKWWPLRPHRWLRCYYAFRHMEMNDSD